MTEAISNSAKIIVNDPSGNSAPEIVTKQEVVVAQPESTIIIPCVAHAHPPPTYRWFLNKKGSGNRDPLMLSNYGRGIRRRHSREELLILPPDHEVLRHSSRRSKVTCETYNDIGSDTMEVIIEREISASVEIRPKLLVLDASANGNFQCKVSPVGHGPVTYSWYKDGQLIASRGDTLMKGNGETLEVLRAKRQDAGIYQCFIKIREKVYQASSELRLGASPPQFLYRFIQQTLTPGPAVSLKCIATGSPTPTISWTLDGFQVPQSDRIIMGQYVSLTGEVISHVNISSTRVEDGGEFSCTAENSAGSISHEAPLYIYGPPHVRKIGTLTAVAGVPFTVRCPVAGYPMPTVTWTKGGRELPLSRRHDVSGPELKIYKVNRESDEGHYVCTASDRQGRVASKTLHLKVVEPPKVAPFSLPSSLTSGSRLAVQCVVEQGDAPVELQWFHNQRPAQKTPGVTVTPLGQFILALIIDSASPVHAGNYTCKVSSTNGVPTSDSHSSILRVNVSPRWRSPPRDVSVVKGSHVIIDCDAEGFPPPKVVWRRSSKGGHTKQKMFHNGFNSAMGMNSLRTIKNGSLLLKNVKEDDEGPYLCEVSNGVGSDLSSIAYVNVQVPPKVNGLKKMEIRKGNLAVVRCQAIGDSPLTLSIAKDGQPIDTSEPRYTLSVVENQENEIRTDGKDFLDIDGMKEKTIELKLADVMMQDSGEFSCTAANPIGSHTHITKFVVQDVPDAPRNLRLISEGSRSVKVSWTPASSPNTPVLSYVIYSKTFKENWDNLKNRKIQINGNILTAEIKELLPSSTYQIRISAVNNVGESPPSEALTLHTKGEAPSAPPQNVRAVPQSSTKIKVEWSPPEEKAWHGSILGYYVGYKEENNSSDNSKSYNFRKVEPSSVNPLSWTIGGLKKYRRYEFVIQAYNSLGPGPLSRVVHATTLEDVPEAPPQDVTCLPLTSKSLEVTWLPPPDDLLHGKVISYSVVHYSFHRYSFSSPKETRILTGKSSVLNNLKPYTNYSITVAALTKAGVGKESRPVTCITDEDVPDSPAGIKGLVSGSNEVVAVWSDPANKNGILTKFTLYLKTNRGRDVKRRIVPAQSYYYEIANLQDGENVEMWVTAATRVGEGRPTQTVSVSPSVKVPGGIKSMGEQIRVAQGSDVLLGCPFLGVPLPSISWRKDEMLIDKPTRWKRQPDGGLLLHDSKLENSGNYSCHVSNIYGSDRIFYHLIVMVPPRAPKLRSIGSTENSVTVSWQLGEDGGSPIDKLTLTWRPDHEEWREEVLQRHSTSYTLQELSCGTSYHLYLSSQNAIGPGPASEMVSVRTKGSRPTTPPQRRVIIVNETSALVNLVPFNDSDCPVTKFFIKAKPSWSDQWITAHERLTKNEHEYLIPNLDTGTEYEMEIAAENTAGETIVRYSFRTLPTFGDLNYDPLDQVREHEWVIKGHLPWTDPAFIVPVILSCIAFVAIVVSVTICLKKKAASSSEQPPQKKIEEIKCLKKDSHLSTPHIYYSTSKKGLGTPTRDIESIDTAPEYAEDIYPYATFQLQQQSDGSTLQTLVFQDPRKSSIHTVAYHKEAKERKSANHGRSLSSGSEYARVRHSRRHRRSYGCAESEESMSETDTDFAQSVMTESSSRIDGHNAHNLLYLTSDASTIPSPPSERKSLPCHSNLRLNCDEAGQDFIYGISTLKNPSPTPPTFQNHSVKQQKLPPSGFRRRKDRKDGLECSDSECDRDERTFGRRPPRGASSRSYVV